MHHEAKVGHHQLAGGVEIGVVVEAPRKRLLLVKAEHRDTMDGRDVGIQTANDAREPVITGGEGLGHVWNLLKVSVQVSSPMVGVLTPAEVQIG
jgi:hypothetical protein